MSNSALWDQLGAEPSRNYVLLWEKVKPSPRNGRWEPAIAVLVIKVLGSAPLSGNVFAVSCINGLLFRQGVRASQERLLQDESRA